MKHPQYHLSNPLEGATSLAWSSFLKSNASGVGNSRRKQIPPDPLLQPLVSDASVDDDSVLESFGRSLLPKNISNASLSSAASDEVRELPILDKGDGDSSNRGLPLLSRAGSKARKASWSRLETSDTPPSMPPLPTPPSRPIVLPGVDLETLKFDLIPGTLNSDIEAESAVSQQEHTVEKDELGISLVGYLKTDSNPISSWEIAPESDTISLEDSNEPIAIDNSEVSKEVMSTSIAHSASLVANSESAASASTPAVTRTIGQDDAVKASNKDPKVSSPPLAASQPSAASEHVAHKENEVKEPIVSKESQNRNAGTAAKTEHSHTFTGAKLSAVSALSSLVSLRHSTPTTPSSAPVNTVPPPQPTPHTPVTSSTDTNHPDHPQSNSGGAKRFTFGLPFSGTVTAAVSALTPPSFAHTGAALATSSAIAKQVKMGLSRVMHLETAFDVDDLDAFVSQQFTMDYGLIIIILIIIIIIFITFTILLIMIFILLILLLNSFFF